MPDSDAAATLEVAKVFGEKCKLSSFQAKKNEPDLSWLGFKNYSLIVTPIPNCLKTHRQAQLKYEPLTASWRNKKTTY